MTVYNTNEKAGCYDNQVLRSNLQSDLCHELRTPLIGILGFSELLMEEKNNCDVAEMATKINICGIRLLEFIDKLLTSSIDGKNLVDIELNKDSIYTEEELRLFRVELLNRFKKLTANGD